MQTTGNRTKRITSIAAVAAATTLLTGAAVLATSGGSSDPGLQESSAAGGTARGSAAADPSLPAPKVDMAIVREAEDGGKGEGKGGGKAVNLTLDDGPDPTWTPKALELLKKYGAKATFCMTGPNAKAHPDLVKQVVAAGHRLCDHSVSHDTAMDKKSVDYQKKEILDAKRLIDAASGGEKIWYYRAPGGAFTPQSRQIAASEGMRNLGWNVDPGDFNRPGTDTIVRAVKNQLKNGPTVLMHDGGGNRAQTMQALEQLLPWLKEEGYRFGFPKATS